MESTWYVLSFRIVFFYLVATGWIFYIISLCETSSNQSINTYLSVVIVEGSAVLARLTVFHKLPQRKYYVELGGCSLLVFAFG